MKDIAPLQLVDDLFLLQLNLLFLLFHKVPRLLRINNLWCILVAVLRQLGVVIVHLPIHTDRTHRSLITLRGHIQDVCILNGLIHSCLFLQICFDLLRCFLILLTQTISLQIFPAVRTVFRIVLCEAHRMLSADLVCKFPILICRYFCNLRLLP